MLASMHDQALMYRMASMTAARTACAMACSLNFVIADRLPVSVQLGLY